MLHFKLILNVLGILLIAIGLLILNIVYLYFLGGIATYQDILEIYNI